MAYLLLLLGDVPDLTGSFFRSYLLCITTICNDKAISEMERWWRSHPQGTGVGRGG
jgi:hypothetical protein